MLTRRTVIPERMDDPSVDPAALAASLRFIRGVNRRLGGTAAAIRPLQRWSRAWRPGRRVTVLDVGTGAADIPLAILRWGQRRGFEVRVTGVDAHPLTLRLAREHVGERPEIELVETDARRLTDRFEPGSFDYAHAGMFLHHLDDIEVMTVLRMMDRLTVSGLIWNDLVRGPIEKLFVRVLVVGQPEIVRHDALASVAAGFRRQEALDLAGRVGLPEVRYHRHLFGRFTLTSTKP